MEITASMINWPSYFTDHKEDASVNTGVFFAEEVRKYGLSVFAKYLTNDAQEQIIAQYSPDYVELYYVDYRDDLDNRMDLCEEAVQANSLQPIEEDVWNWWDYPEGEYLAEIEKDMVKDGLGDFFEPLQDGFREMLYEKDKSTPVKDLLNNTGAVACFYSLGINVGEPHYGYEPFNQVLYKLRRALGIRKDTPEAELVKTIYENSGYGGELRIYFSMNIEDLITIPQYDSESDDWKSIKFNGEAIVALLDSYNGSAYYEPIKINLTLPFIRENLHISSCEKYSMEHICGICSDWCDDYASPDFSFTKPQSRRAIAKSNVNANNAHEQELERVFRAGGCTFGDMDMRRHRDVRYDNSLPCGNRCPHCGTFWID